MSVNDTTIRLDGGATSLVLFAPAKQSPQLLYLGARLAPGVSFVPGAADLVAPIRRESAPDAPCGLSLAPVNGFGFLGEPALSAHRNGDGALALGPARIESLGENGVALIQEDARLAIELRLEWRMDVATGVIAVRGRLTNIGAEPLALDWLAALALPLPDWARTALIFDGRWAGEQRPHRIALTSGTWSRTTRGGRSGFSGSTLVLCAPSTDDLTGPALGVHLGWSGSNRLLIETRPEGDRQVQVGAWIAPGEILLAPGATFETPSAYLAWSDEGISGLSGVFHPYVQSAILPPLGPRKVHFNTWEAVYFGLDDASLKALAGAAAALGAERFVIDDGWFVGRGNDEAGLGDWRVDTGRFPDGLAPVCAHVHALGMDVGLWVEPEMVSPSSDLARAHPDWVLCAPAGERPTMRHQWVLDLANPAVCEHIFAVLDELLRTLPIAYLKWDFNRDLFPAPRQHARTLAFYDLLARLRAAHPAVEIESCSSGGARADLGVLRYATRLWPSDQTDAVERLRIQRWAGLVFPLSILGAHVGPSPNPITGRRATMDFRAKVALFGHFGVEADPARLDEHERELLAAHIKLYKDHRAFLHAGRFRAFETADGVTCFSVTAWDGARQLALLAQPHMAAQAEPQPIRLPGLIAERLYRVRLLDPMPVAARRLGNVESWRNGMTFPGAVIAGIGLRLPLIDPHTGWLLDMRAVD